MTTYEVLALPLADPIAGNYRSSDPVSSVAAARTCNAEAQRGRILECLRASRQPLYAAQIAQRTGIPAGEVGSRLPVLKRLGSVALLPEMGVNHRGQPVQLWIALSRPVESVATASRL